jgi:MarR family transcriptional regulator, transcriptional regulator for hemolysin
MPATRQPLGLQLTRTAQMVRRGFDETLAEAGGSLPVWLVLLSLKTQRPATQRELAEAVGVREATLTHHLNALATQGLVTRRRDAANRRVQVVELTDAGEALFFQLRTAAVAFDKQLRGGLTAGELRQLQDLLDRLALHVGADAERDGRHQ